ncbi:LexA family protein [Vibrio mediterranei]|uniref:LexA family protein n=1 Tax=Vibrio mediterranei TaxID=689 RepID=UPI0040683540
MYHFPSVTCSLTRFESPAKEYRTRSLSINNLLLNPQATFIEPALDSEMEKAGIYMGDLLLVDTKIEPTQRDVVVCTYDGHRQCRHLERDRGLLSNANNNEEPSLISEGNEFVVHGVVVASIRMLKPILKVPNDITPVTSISLDELLIENPNSTFLARASGSCMQNAGIFDGDVVLVDRKPEPQHMDVVICALDGQFSCKYLDMKNRQILSAESNVKPVTIATFKHFSLEGIVTRSIRLFRKVSELQ